MKRLSVQHRVSSSKQQTKHSQPHDCEDASSKMPSLRFIPFLNYCRIHCVHFFPTPNSPGSLPALCYHYLTLTNCIRDIICHCGACSWTAECSRVMVWLWANYSVVKIRTRGGCGAVLSVQEMAYRFVWFVWEHCLPFYIAIIELSRP